MDGILTISGLGRVVRGAPTADHQTGLFVGKNGFQGWEGLPAGRREALARAMGHGEHDTPVKLPSRVITIDGWIIAHTMLELRRFSQSVTGWGATGDRFPLLVDHQLQMLTAMVRRISAEAPDTGTRWGRFLKARFQVQFLAADPRRYGGGHIYPDAGSATSISVEHDGNFPAYPVVEIPAAPANYTITSPAGVFTVAGATAGGTHRVDLRTGRVTRDGVAMPVGRGRLWAVPDGQRWTHVLSAPGRVLIEDTYV